MKWSKEHSIIVEVNANSAKRLTVIIVILIVISILMIKYSSRISVVKLEINVTYFLIYVPTYETWFQRLGFRESV